MTICSISDSKQEGFQEREANSSEKDEKEDDEEHHCNVPDVVQAHIVEVWEWDDR